MANQKAKFGSQEDDRMAVDNEMENLVPSLPSPNPMASQDSRVLVRAHASPAARKNIVQVRYEGHRRSSNRVAAAAGEHQDIVVPDKEDNPVAVEDYMDGMQSPSMSNEEKTRMDAAYNNDSLHMVGQQYHFVGGEVSDVYEDHLQWLLDHPSLKFSLVSRG